MSGMLPIKKGKAPQALTNAVLRIKSTPDTTLSWSAVDGEERAAIVESLLVEQGSLCAYCSRRIDETTAHVEHYIPQSAGAGQDDPNSVSYGNLLAVCDGFEGSTLGMTCDKARQNTPLTVNPLKSETLASIRFRHDGTIYANDESVNKDVAGTLNLNQELLRRNRHEALRRMEAKLSQIGRRRGNAAVTSFCQRYVDEHLNNPQSRIPYDDIVIYYMEKRARAGV